MTIDWRAALDQALRANEATLADVAATSHGTALGEWASAAIAGVAQLPSPSVYLALSDLTGIGAEVLAGDVNPSDTLAVALRTRGHAAPEAVLTRSVQLLRAARAVLRLEPHAELLRGLQLLQQQFRQPPTAKFARSSGQRAGLMMRAHLGLGTEPILDLAELVETLGVAVEYSIDLPHGLHGMTSWTHTPSGWIATITINARDFWTVQRYSLAHEFCHVLHEDRPQDLTTELNDSASISSDPSEARAEAFASSLLAPRAGLAAHWIAAHLGDQTPLEAAARVMWHWGISRQAAGYALQDCPSIRWTAEHTATLESAYVAQMIREAGLADAWAKMAASEGVFAPSVWLAETTAELFVARRLPVEDYAIATNQEPEQALRQLVG